MIRGIRPHTRLVAWKCNKYRQLAILLTLAVLIIIASIVALRFGAVTISFADIFIALRAQILGEDIATTHSAVLNSIRIPRIIFGLIIGAVLGVAGAALQGIFKNPLADPGLIGVSSGAALGVGITIIAGITGFLPGIINNLIIPIAGFVGGSIAVIVVYLLATRQGRTDVATLLLAGIAINAFCGAGLGILIYLSDDTQLRNLTMWTLGSLGGATWRVIWITLPFATIAILGLMKYRSALNLMLLGESEAHHLGIDPDKIKRRVVALSALAVGATVGFTGMIGFIGLIVPHLLRLICGPDNRFILPGSALLGALLLLSADIISRTLAAPTEIPIGVVTSLIGAPFFLYLLLRNKQLRGHL